MLDTLIKDSITVFSLLIKYFTAGWVLILFSCLMVQYLSMKNALTVKKSIMENHITTRQRYYQEMQRDYRKAI